MENVLPPTRLERTELLEASTTLRLLSGYSSFNLHVQVHSQSPGCGKARIGSKGRSTIDQRSIKVAKVRPKSLQIEP